MRKKINVVRCKERHSINSQKTWILFPSYYRLNVCVPLNLYVEILMLSVMGLGCGVFERGLSPEGRVLMNGISAFIKEILGGALMPLTL